MKEPKIVTIEEKKLVGARTDISLVNDKTGALWQSFMPKRHQIKNRTDNQYYSIQNYHGVVFPQEFTDETVFEKWAAVEVSSFSEFPEEFETMTIPSGQYAVFIHHGLASDFRKTMEYIFGKWLPGSRYQLDSRPHFEVMGDKYYGPTDANSEEEIWIPIK